MTYSVSVSPDVYAMLRKRARQSKVSPDRLVDDALRQYLSQDEQAWRRSLDALLARVQVHSYSYTSQEIEADITAAAQVVQEMRRANRSSH